ncbi:MAG: glycosyltransferase [Planctomycetes bacterium]|nr:glycosyltransferase [Planctomycetota bacterium]
MIAALLLAVCYLVYRGLFTLYLETPFATILSLSLYLAEIQGCIALALYFFQVWDVAEPAPVASVKNHTVDVMVPTYNEDVDILRTTLQACVALDHPHTTYVLDDGNRPEMKALADELGVRYIARESSLHAKAGNLNHALERTQGDLVVILDADHVPARHFLTRLVGYFDDDEVGIVQTPHSFYNFDNFQGTCDYDRQKYWDEGMLFYRVIQPGLNRWNSVIFAGSAAMFRRKALEQVGYIAVETITEDMHTGIRLASMGWKMRYVSEPLVAGQAVTDVESFHVQRLRWGAGNLSILFHDNPLTKPGLTLAQRISYFASIISWSDGLWRLPIYCVPILMLLTGVPPMANFDGFLLGMIVAYLLTIHLALKLAAPRFWSFTGSNLFGMLCFWTQVRATLAAFFKRRNLRFVVTKKRGGGGHAVLRFILPQLTIFAACALALVWGFLRLAFGMWDDLLGFAVAGAFVCFHMVMAWKVVRRSLQVASRRFAFRHPAVFPLSFDFETADGLPIRDVGVTSDVSQAGLSFITSHTFERGMEGDVCILHRGKRFPFRAAIRNRSAAPDHVKKDTALHRYGVEFLDPAPGSGAEVEGFALQFSQPRMLERMTGGRHGLVALLRRWKRSARQRNALPYRLPVTIELRDTHDETLWSELTITDDLSREALRAPLALPLEVGQEVRFTLRTPLGPVEGTACVLRSRNESIGTTEQVSHVFQLVRFEAEGRSRYQTLIGHEPRDRHQHATFRAMPLTRPLPLLLPLLAFLGSMAIVVPTELTVFREIHDEDVFWQRVQRHGFSEPGVTEDFVRLRDEALAGDPDRSCLDRLLDVARALEHPELVRETLERMRAIYPDDPDLLLLEAEESVKAGRHDEAAQAFDRCLAHELDERLRRQARIGAARNEVARGNDAAAIAHFETLDATHALEDPELFEYVGLLHRNGRELEAIDRARSAGATRRAALMQADWRASLQDFPGCEEALRRGLHTTPGDRELEVRLADCCAWQERPLEALELLRPWLERDPNDRTLMLRMAQLELATEEPERALAHVRHLLMGARDDEPLRRTFLDAFTGATTVRPEDVARVRRFDRGADAWTATSDRDALARALRRIARDEGSLEVLERAVFLSPLDRDGRLELADRLYEHGRYAEADVHYRHLLDRMTPREEGSGR